MPMRRLRHHHLHHRLGLAALLALACAPAGAQPQDDASVLRALAQGGEVACQPSLPHFCDNMHVRCAGLTTVPTFAFTLRAGPGAGAVALRTADEDQQRLYQGAQVEWAADGSYVLLTPRHAAGYVKLLAGGNHVVRHYIQGRGVMSLGQCRLPAPGG